MQFIIDNTIGSFYHTIYPRILNARCIEGERIPNVPLNDVYNVILDDIYNLREWYSFVPSGMARTADGLNDVNDDSTHISLFIKEAFLLPEISITICNTTISMECHRRKLRIQLVNYDIADIDKYVAAVKND